MNKIINFFKNFESNLIFSSNLFAVLMFFDIKDWTISIPKIWKILSYNHSPIWTYYFWKSLRIEFNQYDKNNFFTIKIPQPFPQIVSLVGLFGMVFAPSFIFFLMFMMSVNIRLSIKIKNKYKKLIFGSTPMYSEHYGKEMLTPYLYFDSND